MNYSLRSIDMRKIFTVILMIVMLILLGCGNNPGVTWNGKEYSKATFTERRIYADDGRSCFCIVNKDDIEKMLSAAQRKDVQYLDGMLADGRAFAV